MSRAPTAPEARQGVVEASAPARIPLAGPPLDLLPPCSGFVSVGVAIDRRVACRLERGQPGVRIESRDTLSRRDGARAKDLRGGHDVVALAARVLDDAGLDSGVRLVTESRVPAAAGLAGTSALAVAVAAAARRSLGLHDGPEGLWTLGAEAEARWRREATHEPTSGPAALESAITAVWGGIVTARVEPGRTYAERVGTDPACVEECLMLFESGEPPAAADGAADARRAAARPSVRAALDRASALAAELDRALRSHRYESVVELMREESRIIGTAGDPALAEPVRGIAEAAEALGGAARRCGLGRAVAVWAPPGRTAAVAAAVAAAGFRRIPFRVDLRGLEVEQTPMDGAGDVFATPS